VLAELLAPRARSIVCVDASERVVAAARERLKALPNVEVTTGDMHALDFPAKRFDLVLLLHALTYSGRPGVAIAEGARVLRKGGRLLAMTLGKHAHRTAVEPFDHRNLGFRPEELREFARAAKLEVVACERLTRERRPPHFEVLSLLARKP
jgi:ArsR family transcriptional regulator